MTWRWLVIVEHHPTRPLPLSIWTTATNQPDCPGRIFSLPVALRQFEVVGEDSNAWDIFSAPCIIVVWKTDTLYICFLKWPPQHINGNSNQVRFGMNTTTSWIPKWFLTAQTVDPQRFLSPVPNESIADKHPINIQIFCRKLRFRCQRTLCIIFRVQDQVRYTVWWLHWPVYAL